MSVIDRMRQQNAIYWPPGGFDGFGRAQAAPLVELALIDGENYCVRWEDTVEEFVDRDGTVLRSNAIVYVPRLPDGSEVRTGGHLKLGNRGDLKNEHDPKQNEGVFEIKRVDQLPDFKAKKFLRTCYL